MDNRATEYSRRIDGKYCAWQKFDLLELGEISAKTAKVAYKNFDLPLPTRWVIVAVEKDIFTARTFVEGVEKVLQ